MNHYEVLNVTPDASLEEIRQAYRGLARQSGKDILTTGQVVSVNEREPQQIREAWEVLGNPKSRGAYNESSPIAAWMLSSSIDIEQVRLACASMELTKLEKQARKLFHESREAFEAGKLDESTRLLQQAIKLDQTNPLYQRNMGLIHSRNKMYEMALTSFERALELDPLDPKTLLGYGRTLLDVGRVFEARKVLTAALQLDPLDQEINDLLKKASTGWQMMLRQRFHPAWFAVAFLALGAAMIVLVWLLYQHN